MASGKKQFYCRSIHSVVAAIYSLSPSLSLALPTIVINNFSLDNSYKFSRRKISKSRNNSAPLRAPGERFGSN